MALKCTLCGGDISMQADGQGLCSDCGMAYTIDALRSMISGGVHARAEAAMTSFTEKLETIRFTAMAMLLAENMSAFGNDDRVSDSMNINDITADTSLTDTLLIDPMN